MRFRRVLLYSFVIVVALIAGLYVALTQTGLAQNLVLDSLYQLFEAPVQLDKAELDPIEGTVRLENLRMTPTGKDGVPRNVLQIPEAVVGVSMNPLGRPGEVQTVLIERPELDIYLGQKSPIDLESLFKDQGGPPAALPSTRIKDMTVRLHLPGEQNLTVRLGPIQLQALVDADDPQRLVLEGECPNPLGGMIRIRGSCDVAKQEFRLLAEAGEFLLRRDGMQAFGEGVARFVAERQLEGRVKPTLWLNYPDAQGDLAGGIRSTFSRLTVLPPEFEYLFTHLDGSASITSKNNGTIEVRVDRSGTDLELQGSLRISNIAGKDELELRATARNVQINQKLEHALRGLPPGYTVYEAFHPANGRGDLQMHLHTGIPPQKAENPVPNFQLDLELRGLDARFDGIPRAGRERIAFPYPLTDVHASLEIRDEFVTVNSFTGVGQQGGRFEGRGEFDMKRDELRLVVGGEAVPLIGAIRGSLDRAISGGSEIFDRFQPRGEADFTFRIEQRPDLDEPPWELEIRPQGASATWELFPHRLDNIVGAIHVAADHVLLDLRGHRGTDTDLETRAFIRFPDETAPGITEIRVVAKNAELTDELRKALHRLDPSFQEQWDLFSPRGRFDLDFLGWKVPGSDELTFDLRADLRDVRATFTAFPVPMRSIRGPVVMHGDGNKTRVEILGLTGRGLDARLLFRGAMEFRAGDPAAGPTSDLSVVAKGVHLRQELIDVLVDLDFITRQFWQMAEIEGSVDAIIRIRREATDPDWRQEFRFDLRQVTSRADLLPDTLTRMSGEVRIDEKHVIHLKNMTGYVGESLVTCSAGRIWQQDRDTYLYLDLSADSYPVDERLANLLDGEVKKAFLDRKARGRVSVVGLRMTLKVPSKPPPGAAGLGVSAVFDEAEFRAENLSMEIGIRVTDINGRVVLTGGYFDHAGSRVAGWLSGLSFVAVDQMFNDARGSFIATHQRFTIPAGSVHFHGGQLHSFVPPNESTPITDVAEPLIHFDLGPRRHLDVNLTLTEVNLERLLSGFQTNQNYRGLLNGQVRLSLDTTNPTTLAMQASFGVGHGYLGDVPVFRSIYSLLRPEKRPTFREGVIRIDAKDGVLRIPRLMVRGPLMRVEGKGKLRYDGYLKLEIEFPNLFPEASPLTLLPGIYWLLANSLVSYDVVGFVGNTRTGARFVPLEGDPKRVPLAPLPGRSVPLRPIFQ